MLDDEEDEEERVMKEMKYRFLPGSSCVVWQRREKKISSPMLGLLDVENEWGKRQGNASFTVYSFCSGQDEN